MSDYSFAKDGMQLFKNVFTKNEVYEMRHILTEHFTANGGLSGRLKSTRSAVQPDSFSKVKDLSHAFFSNGNIAKALKDILGPEPVYLHHCDCHMNWSGGLHRDSIDKGSYFDFMKNDIWGDDKKNYRVVKVAMYLQDHTMNAEGFNVRRQSNLSRPDYGCFLEPIRNDIGDILIFDTRLLHRGVTSTQLTLDGGSFKSGKNRFSIFASFGVSDAFSRDFALGNLWREMEQNSDKEYSIDRTLADILSANGIQWLSVPNTPKPGNGPIIYSDLM